MTIDIADANSAGLENKVRRNLFIYSIPFVTAHIFKLLLANFSTNTHKIIDYISGNVERVNDSISEVVYNVQRV